MIQGNHKPALAGVDEAIRRRFLLLPFSVTVPDELRDPNLSEKLKAEWPGILAWAIQGSLDWQAGGLQPPPAVLEATERYLEAEDSLQLWLADRTEPDPNAWEPTEDLFRSWAEWAKAAGEEIGTQKRFVQALENVGYTSKRNPQKTKRGFKGLRLIRVNYADDLRYGG
jgi:putative DNA primase/helicase